jgi:ribokinase
VNVAVVGHVEWVEFVTVDHVPVPGEIVHARSSREEPGGGGAGAAVQLLKLAGAATFFTALGDDALGRRALAELERFGLRVHAATRPEPTRRAITHVDSDGERTITVIGDRLGPSDADPLPWNELDGADAVYFTAGDDGALRAARGARVLVATARASDVLARGGVQLDALVGSANDPSESFSPDDIVPEPRLCVWTDGGRGGTYKQGAAIESYLPVAPPGPIVDRYGAGDSFAAGLTFGLGEGRSTSEALDLAARCGAAALTGAGPYEGQLRGI